MIRLSAALVLVLSAVTACAPQARPASVQHPVSRQTPFDIGKHVQFILDSQRPTGAIAMTPQQESINPYFANLAATALLRHPGHLDAVERYLDWYLANIKPDGTIDDFVVIRYTEVGTGKADSTDSYAATFLSLVVAWVDAGGNTQWLQRNRSHIDLVKSAILAVTDRDGLTWAKPGYPLKLLMDNCEVYRGWRDWSRLMRENGDHAEAIAAGHRADRIAASLPRFRQSDGTWGWAINRLGILHRSSYRRFYPDGVAQIFPLTWGLTSETQAYHSFDAGHPEWRDLNASDFPWLLPAYTAALAGDFGAVRQALSAAGHQHGSMRWPWYVAESAWVIKAWTLTQ